jgi:hypothetical protein
MSADRVIVDRADLASALSLSSEERHLMHTRERCAFEARRLPFMRALSALVALAPGYLTNCSRSSGPTPDAVTTARAQALFATPEEVGDWTEPFPLNPPGASLPFVAVHMALMKNGKVLMWNRYNLNHSANISDDAVGSTPQAYEFDPLTRSFTSAPNATTNLFCAGHSTLSDGRVLVVGGHVGGAASAPDQGVADVNAHAPGGASWTTVPPMSADRWYASSLALPSGETLVMGGTFGKSPSNVRTTPEVLSSNWSQWRSLTAATLSWYKYYPWTHVLSDGRVFYSGAQNTTRFINTTTGVTTPGPARSLALRDYGTSVMYDVDKILVLGGGSPPTATGGRIDLSQSPPLWAPTPMVFARKLHNSTILADGTVFVTNGTSQLGDPGMTAFEDVWSQPTLAGDATNKALSVAAAPFADGRQDIYMIGLDHAIWHRFQDSNGNWQPAVPPNYIRIGTLAASEISVTRLPNGSCELAAIDTANGNLWHINIPASGTPITGFTQIGDNSNKAKHINISQFQDGRLVVFMVGLDDVIWQTWQNAVGTWLPTAAPHFEMVGDGSPTSRACTNCPSPMLVSRIIGGDAFDVVILDQNRNLRNLLAITGFFPASNNFYLINSTANMGTQIAVNRRPDNRLELFMLGLDGRVWRTWQTVFSSADNPGGIWQTTAPNNLVSLGATTARTLATIRTLDGHSDLFIIGTDGVLSHTNGEYLGPTIFKNLQGNNYRTPGAQLVVSQYQQNLDGIRLDSRTFVTFPDENVNVATGFSRQGPVFATELWDPQSTAFTTMASSQVPRAYHSTAVLLPDGKVLLAGGGAGGNSADPNHANAEIYSPPYLYKPPVTVLSAPVSIQYNVPFAVQVDSANIAAANLIGLSQTTHSFNQGQRLNHLTVNQSGSTVTITPPQDANHCPPGPYMLFLVSGSGGISKAQMVQIN